MAASLYSLLQKETVWQWGKKKAMAFCRLKEAVMAVPAFAYPRLGKPFILELAMTMQHTGAILSMDKY